MTATTMSPPSPSPVAASPGPVHRGRRCWLRRASAAAVAAVVVAGGAVGVHQALSSSGYELTGVFINAGELLRGSVVRVDGVDAGSVTSMTLRHNEAWVAMHINPEFLPIHRDATLTVRPVSLLGARYIDLQPGTASSPAVPSGSVIPPSQTSDSVNIQDIFNVLNDPTSGALAALLASLGQGTAGQGPNIAATLHALAPVLGNVQPLLTLLDQQDKMLSDLVSQVAPITSALATAHGQALAGVVASATQLLQATAGKSQQLGATIAQLPSTMSAAQQALTQVGTLAAQATPALASLTPLTSNLTQIVGEIRSFASAANPALTALDPVLTRADSLLVSLRPVVDQLQAAGPSLLQLSSSAQPIVGDLTANLSNLFNFIENWALVTNGTDGVSHYFRAMVMANPNAVTGNSPTTVPGIGPFAGGAPLAVSHRAPSPAATLPQTLNQLVNPVTSLLGGLLSGSSGTSGSSGSSGSSAASSPGNFPLSSNQIGALLGELGGSGQPGGGGAG